MAPIPRLRDEGGHPLWSYGFRPFFLFGSLFSTAAMLAWLPFYYGQITIPTAIAAFFIHGARLLLLNKFQQRILDLGADAAQGFHHRQAAAEDGWRRMREWFSVHGVNV